MEQSLKIEYKPIKTLVPYEKNAKKHPKEQVERIAESIKQFGFTQPVLVDKNNCVIAGHGRVLGAKKAGLKQVPCVYLEELTEEQVKAYRLVDNKLNESAWDYNLLDEELTLLPDDIDMSLFGFDMGMSDEEIEQNMKEIQFAAKQCTKVVVEFENKKAAEQLFQKLVSEGYICKMR